MSLALSRLDICHGHLDIDVFVVLVWTRCRRRCLAMVFAMGVSSSSSSSLCWRGPAAVVVVSPWHLPRAFRRQRLRCADVDALPLLLLSSLRDVGVDLLLSSSSHLGICHRRLNVVVFVDLAWIRCCVGHGG